MVWKKNWKWIMPLGKSFYRRRYIKEDVFYVQKHHLDTNHHVNNCQYVQMAMDYLPANYKIYQMRAEYKQQARLNDQICPGKAEADGVTKILLNDRNNEPYAVVEFMENKNVR